MSESRKLFKFYKSYFDVAELLNDKDRLAFYDAIMNRQFYGIQPNLKGNAKLAYISQKFNIDSQVKGWEDKMNTQLSDNHAMQGGIVGGSIQEEVKEKEKEEVKHTTFTFDEFWQMYAKSRDKKLCQDKYNKISETDREKIKQTLPDYIKSTPDTQFRKDPIRYLKNEIWNDVPIFASNVTETVTHQPTNGLIDLSKIYNK